MYKFRFARTDADAAFIDACATSEQRTRLIAGENIVGITNHYLWLRSQYFPDEVHDEEFYLRKHTPEALDKDGWFAGLESFDAIGMIWIDKATGQDIAVTCDGMVKMTGSVGQRYGVNFNDHPDLLNTWIKKTNVNGTHPDHRGNRHMAFIHRIHSHYKATKFPDMKQTGHMHVDSAWKIANAPESEQRNYMKFKQADGTVEVKSYVQMVHDNQKNGQPSALCETAYLECGHRFNEIEPNFDSMNFIYPAKADEMGGIEFDWAITRTYPTIQKKAWKALAEATIPAEKFPIFHEYYVHLLEDLTQIGRRSSDNKICLYPDTDNEMSIRLLFGRVITDQTWIESNLV